MEVEASDGPIIYADRCTQGFSTPAARIAFTKPPSYAEQKEFRFIWQVENPTRLEPFLLDVPRVAELCSLV